MSDQRSDTLAALILAAVLALFTCTAIAQASDRPSPPLSGSTFQSAETQKREADDAQNPAYLWIEEGGQLWARPEGGAAKSCESCHGPADPALKGIAARYPRFDIDTGGLLNLEGRINRCRTVHQQAAPLGYESSKLLALTAFVSHQSEGVARTVEIGGPAAPFFEAGKAFWQARQGQLNLACTQCHDEHAGKMLRGDRVSQGQSDGWPAYRLEWQRLGSLQRRLRACSLGVRAEVLDYGAPEYLALELYLAWRGEGLPLSAPGVRR